MHHSTSGFRIQELRFTGMPSGISDAGWIVGWSPGENAPFIWTPGEGARSLGTLGGSWPRLVPPRVRPRINGRGDVVGEAYDASGRSRAFLWTRESGMTDLGTLGGAWGCAVDLNSVGQVVGWAETEDGRPSVFLWSADAGMEPLPGPPGNVVGITDSLLLAGNHRNQLGARRGYLWDPLGSFLDLGTLGGDSTEVLGVNNRGQVVGYSADARGVSRAFIWDASSGMRDLGTPFPARSVAVAVNDHGHVVGDMEQAGRSRAFLWDSADGVRELGFSGTPPAPSGNWSTASGINNSGMVVGVTGGPGSWGSARREGDPRVTRWWTGGFNPEELVTQLTSLLERCRERRLLTPGEAERLAERLWEGEALWHQGSRQEFLRNMEGVIQELAGLAERGGRFPEEESQLLQESVETLLSLLGKDQSQSLRS